MRNLLFLFIPLLALPSAVSAASLTEQLQQCAGLQDDSERLACYDSLTKSINQFAEQNFGHEQRQIAEEAPDSITANITEIQSGAYDKLLISLDNGQVWRQNDSSQVHWKSGDTVTVERALFGSFFMKKSEGGRNIRVKRVK